MDQFVIEGNRPLSGRLRVNGSKNAALPQLAAALLSDEPVILRDMPDLADIRNMVRLLGELGVDTELRTGDDAEGGEGLCRLRVTDANESHARYDIVRTMRASICVLGPMLAKRGKARIAMPGGCAIGLRPVDLHVRGMEALGATITLDAGDIVAEAPRDPATGRHRLIGNRIFLGGAFGSTVLGTANVMSAATLARGTTIIESAACEPEIVDLARLLTAMGARIEGAGSPRIIIHGVESLGGADHIVMPDRIEAGTFLCVAAATRGSIELANCPIDALMAVTDRLEAMGVVIDTAGAGLPSERQRATVIARAPSTPLKPIQMTTQPHPGYPTDLQAQLMTLCCLADGNSIITEKIFPERFMHVPELSRMGAEIHREGPTAVVAGKASNPLRGAPVMASDLRASASLVIAALAAEGSTTISRVYHLDRGYERMEARLNALGASVRRVDEDGNDRTATMPTRPTYTDRTDTSPGQTVAVAG
jgi:UDP-N-acetylglucosamine 1-carboxyvinyltransferase